MKCAANITEKTKLNTETCNEYRNDKTPVDREEKIQASSNSDGSLIGPTRHRSQTSRGPQPLLKVNQMTTVTQNNKETHGTTKRCKIAKKNRHKTTSRRCRAATKRHKTSLKRHEITTKVLQANTHQLQQLQEFLYFACLFSVCLSFIHLQCFYLNAAYCIVKLQMIFSLFACVSGSAVSSQGHRTCHCGHEQHY